MIRRPKLRIPRPHLPPPPRAHPPRPRRGLRLPDGADARHGADLGQR